MTLLVNFQRGVIISRGRRHTKKCIASWQHVVGIQNPVLRPARVTFTLYNSGYYFSDSFPCKDVNNRIVRAVHCHKNTRKWYTQKRTRKEMYVYGEYCLKDSLALRGNRSILHILGRLYCDSEIVSFL